MIAAVVGRLGLDRLSSRDRRALALGLLVVGSALLWTAAIRPYLAALEDVRSRAASERALLEREVALLAAGPALPTALEGATAAVKREEDRLVRAANAALAEADLIRYLTLVASTSNVLLQEIRGVEDAAAEEEATDLRRIGLALRGESDLQGVLTFLRGIEQSPLLLRVNGLSIEPAPPEASGQRGGGGRGRGGNARRVQRAGVLQFGLVVEAFAPREEHGAGASP